MATQTEVKVPGDFIVDEWNESYSREQLLITDNATVAVGDVLGIKTGSEYDTLKADPTEPVDGSASAIALEAISGTHTGQTILCLKRGPAVVNKDQLSFGAATAQAQAEAALEALSPGIQLVSQPTDSDTQTT